MTIRVALSNLQRQVIHDTSRLGRPKVESARDAVARINPHVTVATHAVRLTADNAGELVRQYDIVADGSDNFATRYAVSDACFHARKPLVTAAVGQFDGSITTLRPYEAGPDGSPIRPIAACFPRRRPTGSCPPARKPASLAP